jgi:DNA polymerase I-like protein with 3'-5' exonuclease and polymerase domains
MLVALDTESFYSKEVSLRVQGVWHYLRHPNSSHYLLSVVTDTGIEYVGHPKDFDWSLINREDAVWLSHNAAYDTMVVERLQELGHAPNEINITDWHCTADMSCFLGAPRSLKEASRALLGTKVSKEVRDNMEGQYWEDMDVFFQDDVRKYALEDSRLCLNLFIKYGHLWPEHERKISRHTREMCSRGVPLDMPALDHAKDTLEMELWKAKTVIPWALDRAVLSTDAIRKECIKHGIDAPASFSEKDDHAQQWEEKYAEKFPWIKAIRNYRKTGKHLASIKTMLSRVRPDGTMPYSLKYFGAHTGRFSGDAGWNAQNLPKGEINGISIRSLIAAPDGYTLAIADLSQIEPRVLSWLAGDDKMLAFIRDHADFYEAQARAMGLWSGDKSLKSDPAQRHLVKGLNLGLGYGMGANKFSMVSGIDLIEADRLTKLYRQKNPKITAFWRNLEEVLRSTAASPDDHDAEIDLPSGRKLTYRRVSVENGGLTTEIPRLGKLMRLGTWGGSVCENVVQACARDVFMDCCMRIEDAGYPIIMHIHDEVVCLVPEENSDVSLGNIVEIMSTAPEWAEGLPIAAEGHLSPFYKK